MNSNQRAESVGRQSLIVAKHPFRKSLIELERPEVGSNFPVVNLQDCKADLQVNCIRPRSRKLRKTKKVEEMKKESVG